MKNWINIISLVLALCASPAWARSDVPLVDYDNVTISTPSEKKLESSQIEQAIRKACATLGWTVAPGADNHLTASLSVRDKHMVGVDISWTTDAYTIHYQSSINLNYKQKDGQSMIHPAYNKWVGALREGISRELALL